MCPGGGSECENDAVLCCESLADQAGSGRRKGGAHGIRRCAFLQATQSIGESGLRFPQKRMTESNEDDGVESGFTKSMSHISLCAA